MKAERIHIIPVGGIEPLHTATKDCFCFPVISNEGMGQLAVHNAKDLRERDERNGKADPSKVWVQILELVDVETACREVTQGGA